MTSSNSKKTIAVVDLFAGPGGLGEGFSSLQEGTGPTAHHPFRIALSVEKEGFARATLRLRAFYRLLVLNRRPLGRYYDYVAGRAKTPHDTKTSHLWDQAGEEALQLEIGTPEASRIIHRRVKQVQEENAHWVLIGGPPCQAYSLVGRSRNKGKKDYRPEEDQRHFLYRHYLDLICTYRPSVFVMENVKGILSSKVSGVGIFSTILEDLRAATSDGCTPYKIFSLAKGGSVYSGANGRRIAPQDFVIRSELFGIPQARHRVILLGVREDIAPAFLRPLKKKKTVTANDALRDLPKLRSGLSKLDSAENWRQVVKQQARRALAALAELEGLDDRRRISAVLRDIAEGRLPHESRGSLRQAPTKVRPTTLARAMRDKKLIMVLNHEARSHMASDLGRYLFAAAYAKVKGVSPSQEHFPRALAPSHKNWFTGKFADRFRTQVAGSPSSTVTSHIAKDGHYYIHFDPRQCRSLTVREAARLQTFPDNYFFEGNRTEQFIQVGNAVPPMLARLIAKKVRALLAV